MRKFVIVVSWVLVAGCIAPIERSDDVEAGSVATALTDAVQFEGGTVIDGAIPATTDEDVTVAPLDETVIMSPGSSNIMAIEIENPEGDADPVIATLVQFRGESRHIEVQARDQTAEAQTRVRVDNAFEVESDVCDQLCNETFFVTVTEVALLESGAVGASATRTIELDCNDAGDADLCGGGSDAVVDGTENKPPPPLAGEDPGSDIDDRPQPTNAWVERLAQQERDRELTKCMCDGSCPTGSLPADVEDMINEVMDCLNSMIAIGDEQWVTCRLDLGDADLLCEQAALCNRDIIDACGTGESDEALCGPIPDEAAMALLACGIDPSDDGMASAGISCDDGQQISDTDWCDGIVDCMDGSDEGSCGGVAPATEFACGPGGDTVPPSYLCDGTADCASGLDEMVCLGADFQCEGDMSVPTAWVCDGDADCPDGLDEMVCTGGFL